MTSHRQVLFSVLLLTPISKQITIPRTFVLDDGALYLPLSKRTMQLGCVARSVKILFVYACKLFSQQSDPK